jgi:hypothetical protein
MRNFTVAAWEKGRHRDRELTPVWAQTAEEAIEVVAALRAIRNGGAVYEAWPRNEPSCILRVTLETRRPQLRLHLEGAAGTARS